MLYLKAVKMPLEDWEWFQIKRFMQRGIQYHFYCWLLNWHIRSLVMNNRVCIERNTTICRLDFSRKLNFYFSWKYGNFYILLEIIFGHKILPVNHRFIFLQWHLLIQMQLRTKDNWNQVLPLSPRSNILNELLYMWMRFFPHRFI